MKLLLDANGNVVVRNGKPVYVDDGGKEIEFDAPATVGTIARLNRESQTHREGKEAAELALKPFKDAGITDPSAAAAALKTVKNIDDKTLVDAGKVEEVRQAAITATEAKYKPYVDQVKTLETALHQEKIGGAFARSPLIVGDKAKVAIPADLVQARFGQHFKLTADGKVVATDANGNQIYSKGRPGEPADFDEALDFLIDAYPQKDSILRGASQSGSGSQGGSGGSGGKKQITRAAFEALDPQARHAEITAGAVVV